MVSTDPSVPESANSGRFEERAMTLFRKQSKECRVYARFLSLAGIDASKITHPDQIPYLPVSFFKNFDVKTGEFIPEAVFESSSTTGMGVSRHAVRKLHVYEMSFKRSFQTFFGDPADYCHLALLPSYLERSGSSLVYQVEWFIKHSNMPDSAFYLDNHRKLAAQLENNILKNIPTVLWGVAFALTDFADAFPMPLADTIIIETGGMKGRRKEMIRTELHDILKNAFKADKIAGEYGMTELMSQAYSAGEGLYRCPPDMRVSIREVNDPFGKILTGRHGVIQIADLNNVDSCAFISTSDLGIAYEDGSFEVLGRADFSDARGCNLLVA